MEAVFDIIKWLLGDGKKSHKVLRELSAVFRTGNPRLLDIFRKYMEGDHYSKARGVELAATVLALGEEEDLRTVFEYVTSDRSRDEWLLSEDPGEIMSMVAQGYLLAYASKQRQISSMAPTVIPVGPPPGFGGGR